MFSMFKKSPIEKLTKIYESMLEQAMHAQRNGDIKSYSLITAEAEQIAIQIDNMEKALESKSAQEAQ